MHSAVAPLGAWTPRRRGSRLFAWFRADASNILLTSGAVERWYDRSGNGRDLAQSTPANRLGWSASESAFNNRAAVLGTGSGWLDAIAAWTLTQPFTVYVVGQSGSFADWRTILDHNGSGARSAVRVETSNLLATYAGVANVTSANVANASIFATIFNGASSAHYVNSVTASGTSSPGTDGLGTPRVGAGPGGIYPLQSTSRVCELIVLTGADSSDERAQMLRYLRGWYALPITGL